MDFGLFQWQHWYISHWHASAWSNGVKGQTKRACFTHTPHSLLLFLMIQGLTCYSYSFCWDLQIMEVDPNIEQISFMTGTKLHLDLCPCIQMLKVEEMSKKSLESDQKLPWEWEWSFTRHWLWRCPESFDKVSAVDSIWERFKMVRIEHPFSFVHTTVAPMSLWDPRVPESSGVLLVSDQPLPLCSGWGVCSSTIVLTQGMALSLPSVLPVTVPGQRLCIAPAIKPDK